MDDIQFCTACGKQLESGAQYCPACGTTVVGSNAAANQNNRAHKESNDKVKLASILLFAGALISLIMGAYFAFQADAIVDMLIDTCNEMGYVFEDMFFGMTPAEAKDSLVTSGYMMIICGVFCLLSGVLAFTGKFWIITLILTLIATVLGFMTTFVGVIFGILACWYIYSNKDAFES